MNRFNRSSYPRPCLWLAPKRRSALEELMRRCLAFAFLFVFCIPASIFAQEVTGSIFGTVADKTGAIVKDATVTVTNTDRNALIRTVKTNSSGQFSAPLLPIGHYKVSIEAPGFKTYTKNDIVLNVAD